MAYLVTGRVNPPPPPRRLNAILFTWSKNPAVESAGFRQYSLAGFRFWIAVLMFAVEKLRRKCVQCIVKVCGCFCGCRWLLQA